MSDTIKALLFGGQCSVPNSVAICPECGGQLFVDCFEWESSTGFPTQSGFHLDCAAEEELLDRWMDDDHDDRNMNEVGHKHYQSDWQPLIDRVWVWMKDERRHNEL